ncbi:hypothetical protein LA080_000599 [Diaporthe eres]|nr:hypothetical protein LA080_000599 [Diaporthe eres]
MQPGISMTKRNLQLVSQVAAFPATLPQTTARGSSWPPSSLVAPDTPDASRWLLCILAWSRYGTGMAWLAWPLAAGARHPPCAIRLTPASSRRRLWDHPSHSDVRRPAAATITAMSHTHSTKAVRAVPGSPQLLLGSQTGSITSR